MSKPWLQNIHLKFKDGKWEIPLDKLPLLKVDIDPRYQLDDIIAVVNPTGYELGLGTRPQLRSCQDLKLLSRETRRNDGLLTSLKKELTVLQNRETIDRPQLAEEATGANKTPIIKPRKFGPERLESAIQIAELGTKLDIDQKIVNLKLQLASTDPVVQQIAQKLYMTYNETSAATNKVTTPDSIPRFILNRLTHSNIPLTRKELLWSTDYIKLLSKDDLLKTITLFNEDIVADFVLLQEDRQLLLPRVGLSNYVLLHKLPVKYRYKTTAEISEIINCLLGKRPIGIKYVPKYEDNPMKFLRFLIELQGKDIKQTFKDTIELVRSYKPVLTSRIVHVPLTETKVVIKPTFNVDKTICSLIKEYKISERPKAKIYRFLDRFTDVSFQIAALALIDCAIPNLVRERNVFEIYRAVKSSRPLTRILGLRPYEEKFTPG